MSWKRYAKWALQHAKHLGQAGQWYSRRGGPYFKPFTSTSRHLGHFGRSTGTYVRGLHDYYRLGRDLHQSRALESPWKLSMHVFKLIRRVAPWAITSGYFISRLTSWTSKQKVYFIYCIQQELRYGKNGLSAKAFYRCIQKVQTRYKGKKPLRNYFSSRRRRNY